MDLDNSINPTELLLIPKQLNKFRQFNKSHRIIVEAQTS